MIWALSMMLSPRAHNAASSSAMPARMSGLDRWVPFRRAGPDTITRCGSHWTMRAPMSIRRSTKYMRLSNIFSKNSMVPRAWVASTMLTLIRSDGKLGQGPSSTFGMAVP